MERLTVKQFSIKFLLDEIYRFYFHLTIQIVLRRIVVI